MSTADLPGRLSQAEFERRYGTVENATYRALVREIDNRIAQLPAYGGQTVSPRLPVPHAPPVSRKSRG